VVEGTTGRLSAQSRLEAQRRPVGDEGPETNLVSPDKGQPAGGRSHQALANLLATLPWVDVQIVDTGAPRLQLHRDETDQLPAIISDQHDVARFCLGHRGLPVPPAVAIKPRPQPARGHHVPVG